MHPVEGLLRMADHLQRTFLLVSPSVAHIAAIEPALLASGGQVKVEFSAEAALEAMLGPTAPSLALLDAELPGMELARLLAAVRAGTDDRRFPIVVIADTVTLTEDWLVRLACGVIDDLIPPDAPAPYWRLRLDMVMRTFSRDRELQQLREAAALGSQTDPGIYNRATLLSMLFRETDRAQRMNTSLSMILFDIDDSGHWNSRPGAAAGDHPLAEIAERVQRLLRSYDLFGRIGNDRFLLALPGCTSINAVMLAERVRAEIFYPPFLVAGSAIRLSACFGISGSQGRSPVVVLREAEQALQRARTAGPESIQCASDCLQPPPPPVAFLSPTSGDDLLAW